MTDNHKELCERLHSHEAMVLRGLDYLMNTCAEAADLIEQQAARIQQQAARIAELEKERDTLKADSERWREFAEHQTWCADCADSVSTCPIGIRLQEAALQAEKEKRS